MSEEATEEGADNSMASFEEVLAKAIETTYGDPVLISGYAIVAEVIDSSSGEHSLVTLTDTHTPPWDAYGMFMWSADQLAAEDDD